jgi:hypothetical protein
MITMPKELHHAVRTSQGQPIHLVNPETNVEYIILPAEIYNRIHSLFYDDEPLTSDEQRNLLIQAGLRARWDDPDMDIYNDIEPRGESSKISVPLRTMSLNQVFGILKTGSPPPNDEECAKIVEEERLRKHG